MGIGRFAVRVTVGALFIGHGAQKLKGWFGGPGIEGTEAMMESLDMRPARRNAVLSGATEAVGGAMLVVGLGTPFAAAGLIGTMLTAIRKVHWKNGTWNSNGGWEYNATLIATLTALTDAGPGKASLDHALHMERKGTGWAVGALAMGAAASTLAIEMGRRAGRSVQAPGNDGTVEQNEQDA